MLPPGEYTNRFNTIAMIDLSINEFWIQIRISQVLFFRPHSTGQNFIEVR